MSYSIDFTSEAIADLAKIDRTNQIRIARKIKWLGENFEQITLYLFLAIYQAFLSCVLVIIELFMRSPNHKKVSLSIRSGIAEKFMIR